MRHIRILMGKLKDDVKYIHYAIFVQILCLKRLGASQIGFHYLIPEKSKKAFQFDYFLIN
jgi:hypothetical protein